MSNYLFEPKNYHCDLLLFYGNQKKMIIKKRPLVMVSFFIEL
ncbi:MAG: hypothetical protein WJU30_00265 [Candidatus Phytoplasma pruni]